MLAVEKLWGRMASRIRIRSRIRRGKKGEDEDKYWWLIVWGWTGGRMQFARGENFCSCKMRGEDDWAWQ